jgi:hypothetical protein
MKIGMKKLAIMMMLMLVTSIGGWADPLNNPTANQIKEFTGETLTITGTLSADAIAALKELNAAVKNVLLNQATFDVENPDFTFNSTTVKNIVLPKDMDEVKAEWFSGCTSLNAAMSYSSDGKTVKAFVHKAGTLRATMNIISELTRSTIEEAILSGNITKEDLTNQYGTSNAFDGCHIKHYDLSKATLSKSDDLVYAGCDGWLGTDYLEQLELPLNLTAIPANCFQGCKNLTQLYLPSSIKDIGAGAFSMCTSLETVEFGKGFTSLTFSSDVFARSTSLKHVVLPEGLQNIGDGMFNQCESLESIRLPNSLQHIGKDAFKECKSLAYLTIPASVKTIGDAAFENSGIKDIYLMAQTVEELPYIHAKAFGDTPFTGNWSLAIDINKFADRLKKLIKRGKIEGYTDPKVVDSWKTDGNYGPDNMFDKKVMALLPTEEVEDVYRSLFEGKPSIAYLHYPKVDSKGNPTKLSYFIDGNPWKGQSGVLNDLQGFYCQGQTYDGGTRTWYRPIDVESPRLAEADHLSEAYGIGPDAAGNYWPDTNHKDGTLRAEFADPDKDINNNDSYKATATVTESNNPFNGKYMGYSKYYWRNFLLQSGYDPQNDEVFSKWMDDTWYTICFPFDLTDEQLEAAFQSNHFNIAEFSGAAIYPEKKKNSKGEDEVVNNLVLCFTTIAYTWYMDKYGAVYDRVKNGDTKSYYPAKREKQQADGSWKLTRTSETAISSSGDDKDIYESIEGILAIAGHPYMLHPYRVEGNNGAKTLCTIPKVVYKHNYNRRGSMDDETLASTMAAMEKMYNNEAVTRPLSQLKNAEENIDKFFTDENDDITEGHGQTATKGRYDKLENAGIGTYTFKGTYLPSTSDRFACDKKTEEPIPYGAYFLGVASGTKYPQFFREVSKNSSRTTGLWKQYTAIIQPDTGAAAWEAENLNQPTGSAGAKGMSMLFGDFGDAEEVTPDAIEEIIADAEEKGQQVERMNIIVNINGQVVRQGTEVNGLPTGIYIVNGKKYFVK